MGDQDDLTRLYMYQSLTPDGGRVVRPTSETYELLLIAIASPVKLMKPPASPVSPAIKCAHLRVYTNKKR